MAIQPEQILEGIVPIFTKGIMVIMGIAIFMIVVKLILKLILRPKENRYQEYEENTKQNNGKSCIGIIIVLILIILAQTKYIVSSKNKVNNNQSIQELREQLNK